MDELGRWNVISSPQMKHSFSLHARNAKIKNLQEQVNALESKNDEQETEIFNLKLQIEKLLLSKKAINTLCRSEKDRKYNEEEDALLQSQIEAATVEIKRLKGVISEKEKRILTKETWIDTLESVNLSLQREVENLQYRIKEQSDSLVRLSVDTESMEAEVLFEKAENIRKENLASAKIEELDSQLLETYRMLFAEKEIAHQKSLEYEDNLAAANSRAHELSAKLSEAVRTIQELKKRNAVSDNRMYEVEQLKHINLCINSTRKMLTSLEEYVKLNSAECINCLNGLSSLFLRKNYNYELNTALPNPGDNNKGKSSLLTNCDEGNFLFLKSLPDISCSKTKRNSSFFKCFNSRATEESKKKNKVHQKKRSSVKNAAKRLLHISYNSTKKEVHPDGVVKSVEY